MSRDNGIYIGVFNNTDFRVIEANAIDNICHDPNLGSFNCEQVVFYFKEAKQFSNIHDAVSYREKLYIQEMEEMGSGPEYGIQTIVFPESFETYESCVNEH